VQQKKNSNEYFDSPKNSTFLITRDTVYKKVIYCIIYCLVVDG